MGKNTERMKLTRMHWVVIVVIVLGLIGLVVQRVYTRTAPAQQAFSSAELHAAWIARTQEIVRDYESNHDAARARDALLALRVAREDQQAHLDLVLRYERLIDGSHAQP